MLKFAKRMISSKKPHGFLGGKSKNHVGPYWGEGGQKWSKIRPHGLWMPPKLYAINLLISVSISIGNPPSISKYWSAAIIVLQ